MELSFSPGWQQHPTARYVLFGVLAGLANLALLFMIISLLKLLPPELMGQSAAKAVFDANPNPFALFFSIVIFAPLFETLLAQLAPIEIARKLGARKVICVILSAFLFGLGHFLNGGLGHGLTTFCAGLVFAALYVNMRDEGPAASYWVTCIAHATNNFCMFFVILFFPD
ncbi:MAG: CPBP family intramembrane glutamic endopeptidase [Pseudomonadota bacterium]